MSRRLAIALARDARGVAAIEYALLASLIAAAALVGMSAVGDKVGTSYSETEAAMPARMELPADQ